MNKKRETEDVKEKLNEYIQKLTQKQERKLKARQQEEKSLWFWLGMFGMVGWSVAIPTVAGALLGLWIDNRWPGQYSWTLMLLLFGLILGCLNAWFWVKRESRKKD
jgi:ATP synthase protein I